MNSDAVAGTTAPKSIYDMDPDELAEKLRQMGDDTAAAEIEAEENEKGLEGLFDQRPRRPYLYRTHQIGYIPLREAGSEAPIPIRAIGVVEPDHGLLNQRIDIHLDRLYVQEYPGTLFGRGEHHIMVNFSARNQIPGSSTAESAAFSQTYVAFNGDEAGVSGYPVFIGLNVGELGAAFEIETVNVKNSEDEAVLKVLDADEFKNGLNLLNTAQPALAPLTKLATGTTRLIASRSKNVTVQRFYLGLDTKRSAVGGPLVTGNFIVAQVPGPAEIDWSNYHYDPRTGTIVLKEDGTRGLPYNYLIFRVTRHGAGD